MKELISTIIDWIYPPRCISCRNPLPLENKRGRFLWLCSYCENLFTPLEEPICNICSAPVKEGVSVCSSCHSRSFHFIHNRSAFVYEDLVRDMMHEIKFRRRRHVAQGLGRLWADIVKERIPKDITLVPLPMHPKKRRERGFDQAQVLAAAIAETTGIKYSAILERVKDTPPQSGLHPRQRVDNISGAFRVKPGHNITGQDFILVDDIYTTGASLNECAKVLIQGGASKVFTMTLAITIKKSSDDDPL